MTIKSYEKNDALDIIKLGKCLHEDFKFNLDKFSNCLVLIDDNKFIGFVIYSIIYERAEIVDIIIEPKYRNKGYATILLNKVIEISNDKNCINITLEVNSVNNCAIKLYKKHGFKIEATRKKYYNENDGYLMKKDLR